MKYEEQIKSPKWQKKRLEILQRDNFKCCICGSESKTLHVHHLYYEKDKEIWDYPDRCLITLCEDCHDKEHSSDKKVNFLMEEMKKAGHTNLEIMALVVNALKNKLCFDKELISYLLDHPTINLNAVDVTSRLNERMIKLLKKEKEDIQNKES